MLIPPITGVSLFEATGSQVRPWYKLSDNDLRADIENTEHIFYNDLTPEYAENMRQLLKQQSFQTFKSKLTYAAYRDIPTTYLLCTRDNAIPIVGQEGMVEQAKKSGAEISTVTLEASHSPFCSMPDAVAEACQRSVA